MIRNLLTGSLCALLCVAPLALTVVDCTSVAYDAPTAVYDHDTGDCASALDAALAACEMPGEDPQNVEDCFDSFLHGESFLCRAHPWTSAEDAPVWEDGD